GILRRQGLLRADGRGPVERRRDQELDRIHLARRLMPAEAAPSWRIARADRFDWRAWNAEFVVRIVSSGATCLLSAVAGHVLTILDSAGHAADRNDLGVGVFGMDTGGLTTAEMQAVDEALTQLERLGLV